LICIEIIILHQNSDCIQINALRRKSDKLLGNHCGDIGAICNDAAFALMQAHCAVLREQVLRASVICFGHRLLMDCVIPGGVVADLPADGANVLHALVAEIRRRFPPLIELYDNTASLQDRTVGTGFVKPALIRQFGCGGTIGRAGGRAFDARRQPGYPPLYYEFRDVLETFGVLACFKTPHLEGTPGSSDWMPYPPLGHQARAVDFCSSRSPSMEDRTVSSARLAGSLHSQG